MVSGSYLPQSAGGDTSRDVSGGRGGGISGMGSGTSAGGGSGTSGMGGSGVYSGGLWGLEHPPVLPDNHETNLAISSVLV